MTLSLDTLRSADWALLEQMGSALLCDSSNTPIEYRPLRGWPFAWLLHDRFADGLTVADSTSLYRLKGAGLVSIVEWPNGKRAPGIELTRRGHDVVHRRFERSGWAGLPALAGNNMDGNEAGWH